MPDPVYLDDWRENGSMLPSASDVQVSADALAERPFLNLALFWGPDWQDYVDSGELSSLQANQANQYGRFYPAVGDLPPVITLDGSGQPPRVLGSDGIVVLERHGIPIRLDPAPMTTNNGIGGGWLLAGGGVALAMLILLVGIVHLRQRD